MKIIDDLEWQLKDTGEYYTWQEAMEYALSLGDGWRLPTIKELISIIDCDPACKIDNCRSSYYWSSTPYANFSSYACGVNFYNGYVYYSNKSYNSYVRCVRDKEVIK